MNCKKIIRILSTLSIVLLTISSSVQANNVTVKLWKFIDGTADPELQKYIDLWNKEHPDIRVKLETFPWSDYTGVKLSTAFATGAGPDVFWISPGDFMKYVNAGVAAPLNQYFTDTMRKDFFPKSLEAVTVNGNIYSVAVGMEPMGFFYDENTFHERGITAPTNWD